MGWLSFPQHAAVAGDSSEPLRDRSWALRRCCCSVASLVGNVVDTNDLTLWISRTVGARIERREQEKIVMVSKIDESLRLLARLREGLLAHLAEYKRVRRALKQSGHGFPVKRPFTREIVLEFLRKGTESFQNDFGWRLPTES